MTSKSTATAKSLLASDDATLRADVRHLGDLLGQSLVRQEGPELLELVESVRKSVREGGGLDLAFGTALAEAAGHQDAVDAFKIGGWILLLEDFRFDPLQVHLHLVGDAAVDQGFLQ